MRHQQRRGHAFARNVSHGEEQALAAIRSEVAEITSPGRRVGNGSERSNRDTPRAASLY